MAPRDSVSHCQNSSVERKHDSRYIRNETKYVEILKSHDSSIDADMRLLSRPGREECPLTEDEIDGK